jgi:hypothetical protein
MYGFLVVPALLLAAPGPELTLQQVLKANTATVSAIRSVHVTIEISHNMGAGDLDKDKPPTEPLPTTRYEWFLDGERERVREEWLRGRRPHNSDASNGPDGYKRLQDYDPNFEPPLSESIARPAVGEMDKTKTDSVVGAMVRSQAYMAVFGTKLEEFVASNPTSKLAATPATSRRGCYEIALVEQGVPGPGRGPDEKDIKIFVDPAVGFWIRRIEKGPWKKSADPGDKGSAVTEIEEFKDCGNGIFWPLKVHHTNRLPGRNDGIEVRVVHTLHSVNQPLSEQDFAVRFVDWMRVRDRASGKVHIWGPDDKPRMTFNSEGEYLEWWKPRAKDPFVEKQQVSAPRRLGWIAAVNVALGALLVVFVLWLRRRRRGVEGAA